MSLTAVMDQNCVVWTWHPHYCQPRNNSLQHETHCNDNWVCCVSLLIFSSSWQVTRTNTSTVTERFLSSHSSTDFSAQLQLQEIFSRWWTQVVWSGVSSLTGHWQDYTIHQFSRSLEVTRLTWQIQLLCKTVFIVANLANISLWSGLVMIQSYVASTADDPHICLPSQPTLNWEVVTSISSGPALTPTSASDPTTTTTAVISADAVAAYFSSFWYNEAWIMLENSNLKKMHCRTLVGYLKWSSWWRVINKFMVP